MSLNPDIVPLLSCPRFRYVCSVGMFCSFCWSYWGGISTGIASGQSTSWVSTSMCDGAGVLPSITFSADFKVGVTDPCVAGSFVC